MRDHRQEGSDLAEKPPKRGFTRFVQMISLKPQSPDSTSRSCELRHKTQHSTALQWTHYTSKPEEEVQAMYVQARKIYMVAHAKAGIWSVRINVGEAFADAIDAREETGMVYTVWTIDSAATATKSTVAEVASGLNR